MPVVAVAPVADAAAAGIAAAEQAADVEVATAEVAMAAEADAVGAAALPTMHGAALAASRQGPKTRHAAVAQPLCQVCIA